MLSLGSFIAAAVVSQFPTPTSPVIPPKIEVKGFSVCGRTYKAINPSGWDGTVDVTSDRTAFATKKWDYQFMYLRLDDILPDIMKGHKYEVSMEMNLTGGSTGAPQLAFDPQLLLWKEKENSRYIKDTVWPENVTQDQPGWIINGNEIPMPGIDQGNGWVKYSATFTSSAAFPNPTKSLWIRNYLTERPKDVVAEFNIRDVCFTKVAESWDPPPPVASYDEKFNWERPPTPGAELTTQANCPHNEVGTVKWEDTFGTQTSVVLTTGQKVLVTDQSFGGRKYDKIEIVDGSELIFSDTTIFLTVRALIVKGKLRIGSPECRLQGPIDIRFWGDKTDADTLPDNFGTKGMAVIGTGEADIFGRRFFPTWTRLARKVRAGDERVYLQESTNWFVGQEIVLTTTVHDDTDVGEENQNEVFTIKAIDPTGTIIQFTEPAKYAHYAGEEYQGEAALLSRQINVEADAPNAEGFGGHMVFNGARGRIAGVATRYMGQTNIMARYPFHFHLMGHPAELSLFSDNVARDTYFRCFVIHGTHDILETENVAFNATGNCFYVEDGVEENNTVSYNLASYIKVIGSGAKGGGQAGETLRNDANPGGLGSGDRVQPVDATAAGFYFSNSHNDIIGNCASGGWSGFGFPGLPEPIGEFQGMDFVPRSRTIKVFRGNIAHSSGGYWGAAGCIYVGGELTQSGTTLKYISGRKARSTLAESKKGIADWQGTALWMKLENTKVYACNKGILHWGNRVEIIKAEMHDISRAVTLFGEAWLDDSLLNGVSQNTDADYANKHHDGFQFYDISVKSLITNTEFRNYQQPPGSCKNWAIPGSTVWTQSDLYCSHNYTNGASLSGHSNVVFSGPFHSDEFKPQQISAVGNIKYTNVDFKGIVGFKIAESGASRFFNMIDHDGTATKEGRPTVVGSNLNWWQVCDDCRYESAWETWLCPKKPLSFPEREVAYIRVDTPDITWSSGGISDANSCDEQSKGDWSNCDVGYIAHWGYGPGNTDPIKRSSPITSNHGITGITGRGWYMWLNGGAPKKFTVRPSQVPNDVILPFATSYPSGTTFTVLGTHRYDTKMAVTFSLATSLDAMLADPFNLYYFDGENFYVTLKFPTKRYDLNSRFERGGFFVWDVDRDWTITVEASCTSSGGWCSNSPTERVPEWTKGCPDPPTEAPTAVPTAVPTSVPTAAPTAAPTAIPTAIPTSVPTTLPVGQTAIPTAVPTAEPTAVPTAVPTAAPTAVPTAIPTALPAGKTAVPTSVPTAEPTAVPTAVPTAEPTAAPTAVPTAIPTALPAGKTAVPTSVPTAIPTAVPTSIPTTVPTSLPTAVPTVMPTATPTALPNGQTAVPTAIPTALPAGQTAIPTTAVPTAVPTALPVGQTAVPTAISTALPAGQTAVPTAVPTSLPAGQSSAPTAVPTSLLSAVPTAVPTSVPTEAPTPPTGQPTGETYRPTGVPTGSPDIPSPTRMGKKCGDNYCRLLTDCNEEVCREGECRNLQKESGGSCEHSSGNGKCDSSGMCLSAGEYEEQNNNDDELGWWVWLLVASGVLLVCAAIVAAVVVQRQRQTVGFSDFMKYDDQLQNTLNQGLHHETVRL